MYEVQYVGSIRRLKVLCRAYFNAAGREVDESRWLQRGETYLALGVSNGPKSGRTYLLVRHSTGDPLLSLGFSSADVLRRQ